MRLGQSDGRFLSWYSLIRKISAGFAASTPIRSRFHSSFCYFPSR